MVNSEQVDIHVMTGKLRLKNKYNGVFRKLYTAKKVKIR